MHAEQRKRGELEEDGGLRARERRRRKRRKLKEGKEMKLLRRM